MKKLTILTILCFVFFTSNAYGWELYWVNDIQLLGPDNATPLRPYSIVQLIADGGNGVVDDPMMVLDVGEINAWLAAGCPPVGDDYLVVSIDAPNPTIIQDYSAEPGYDSAIYDGWFSAVYIDSALPTPLNVYTRFFSTPEGEFGPRDWYGETGAEMPGQPFEFFSVIPSGAGFATYWVHGGFTDKTIYVPEPATMLIGVTALLLAFFRRKK